MKRLAFDVSVRISFKSLSLEEMTALESFVYDGFNSNTQWGTPAIKMNLDPAGEKEIVKKGEKPMTAKKILELEKEHAGKEVKK
jgi:hypothetical protein